MGKSSSCFRLITCGGDPSEKDDHHQVVSEINSNDKRGWSFRKRSARHRVLSNTVITETPSTANKGSSECTSINFQSMTEPAVVEKVCTTNFSDEKPQLSNLASSEMSETIITETEAKVDVHLPESVVVIVQAAIRGFLAQRALLKSKNAVKLQAAVRGHLVRKHAVGTLRCVQAIVKMQLLVRARHAKQGNEHHVSDVTKSNVTHTSVEKLLNNRFAYQLLESTPKNKPIGIKCDPSKADSAWNWLERWMSVSSKDSAEYKRTTCMSEQPDKTKDSTSVTQLETGVPSEVLLQVEDSKPTVTDSPLPSEDEEKTTAHDTNNFNFETSPSTSSLVRENLEQAPTEKTITEDAKVTSTEVDSYQIENMELEEEKKLTTYDVNDFNFQASPSTSSPVKDNLEQAPTESVIADDAKVNTTEIDSFQNEKMESHASVLQEPSSLSQKPEVDGEQHRQSMKTFASDQLETEGKKSVHGSRKFSNPAFVAAHSKFEELSLTANSGRSSSLFNQDASVESQADTSSVITDTAYKSKELFSENSAPYPSRIGGSECGTELSISSTLDSPDISDVGTMENEHDAKNLAEAINNPENKIDHGVEGKALCATPTSNLPNSDLNPLEIVDEVDDNEVHSVMLGDSKEPAAEPKKNASELLGEKTDTGLHDSKLSPEASPRSHMTIPESQGTPSSQVSVKTKESKVNKSGSSNRRRTLSAANKSPANANYDSGSRGSREQLPKDQLNGKRRKSFGLVKPDHADQELGDNSSNNSSLPHFMQATESARAKINANNSPRSSPDVHDQDIPVKKRHSLPGATGRQDSPRIQRSTSHAQQGAKGNGVNALHERKWLR
ncbi:protein IQ-DOMAIN 32-like isoform X2 [Abrus precatorius]|uniref:Protein IQ-DOMAIN 32-like isoform X2 n=1 Tax=Abrus precatorius TaxID=3816 RepID=A0A8B8JL22_ABRPR|nr:protein IQ-DOMAIN 32-like isoform X2 [Abrus precatorius]